MKLLRIFLLLAFLLFWNASLADAQEPKVLWVEIHDIVSSATVDQVAGAVEEAKSREYVAIVFALNTPGGLVDSTFKITEEIQRSPVPVIGFVYPSGGQALSAGTYILMATDLAAMAPFTRIGSAQPIAGGSPVNDTKFINAFSKQMESFANLHARNSTQVVRFITHNDNLLPEEALARHVIETVASSPEELLQKVNGMRVMTLNGEKTLQTEGTSIVKFGDSPRVIVVRAFSDPIVSNLLVGIGLFVLILGLSTPGWGAEILGVVMLLLGLLGQGFNVNYAALALMSIGAALLLYELYTPGHGILGIGGVVLLGLGTSFFITQPPGPLLINPSYFHSFLQVLIPSYALATVFFGVLIFKFAKVRKMKSRIEKYPSGVGRTVDDIEPNKEGYVIVGGEYWKAKSSSKIKSGEQVKVVGNENDILLVESV
ncbi:MAG: nodulation protein NfeD [Thaumarchaeota archaeon]|nr:nodulation protein NfeD [Nitrososphaerota archaeon]